MVIPAENELLQEIIILMISADEIFFESKPNAKNILHRFKDYIKTHGQIKVSTTSSFILKETCSMKPDDIATLFKELSVSGVTVIV